jgi:hypothetical protein
MRAEVGKIACICMSRPARVLHQYAHDQLAAEVAFQADIVAAGAHALLDLALGLIRNQLGRILVGVAEHLTAGGVDGQLDGAGLTPQIVQTERDRGRGAILDPGDELLGVSQGPAD